MRPPFVYQALSMRVRFGPGARTELGEELDHLGLKRVMVVTTHGRRDAAARLAEGIGDALVGIFPEARVHVPVELAGRAAERARELGADACVALGGGSAIGLGKAIALQHGIPLVAVPTTYAGSEMTPIWGLTDAGGKRTGRDPKVLPASVVYDPELSSALPFRASVTSGLNAVAHAVEALYAPDTNPLVTVMAAEGIRAMLPALQALAWSEIDANARSEALYGAWLCGVCLGATTMGLHHKLCHVLGGSLDLPHGPTHAVVLPYVLSLNQAAAPEARSVLAAVLGDDDPASALWRTARALGAPRSLGELGLREDDIEWLADKVVAAPYANPVAVDRSQVVSLLRAARTGDNPAGLHAA